ncbi:hypothetical protein FKM82_026688 [Ascaphus truei]
MGYITSDTDLSDTTDNTSAEPFLGQATCGSTKPPLPGVDITERPGEAGAGQRYPEREWKRNEATTRETVIFNLGPYNQRQNMAYYNGASDLYPHSTRIPSMGG